ncbi:MAG: response regulator [Candidatus Omnitrophica bacterium]|nr:response regulator [Candidatus Omnitrophota bacterium]
MEKILILLVDDEPDFLEIMSPVIENWGYSVIKAACGRDALDLMTTAKPDIIILDYMMPEMDGVATLRKIREIDKKIPVIMFTAHPNMKALKGTEKLGISAFIPKLSTYSDVSSSLKTTVEMLAKSINKKE